MLEYLALGLSVTVAIMFLQRDEDAKYFEWNRNFWEERCGNERQRRLTLEGAIQRAATELSLKEDDADSDQA